MRILFFFMFFIFASANSGSLLLSQNAATPLRPQSPPKQTEYGLLIGVGNNWMNGIYQPQCIECQFENGNKFGLSIGGVFIKDFNDDFQWGASLLYITKNIETSYINYEQIEIETDPGKKEERSIPFRNTGEFNIAELRLTPFFQWQPVNYFFIRLGLAPSVVINSKFRHIKDLLKFTDTLSTGEIVDISIDGDDPNRQIVEDASINNASTLQLAAIPTIGFNIEISQQIYLSPMIELSIPLTSLTNSANSPSISNWRFAMELRYALKMRKFVVK